MSVVPQLPYYDKDCNTIVDYYIQEFDWGIARVVKYKTKKGVISETVAQVIKIYALEEKYNELV